MANLIIKRLANSKLRILAGVFISVALVPATWAQSPQQLWIGVGANQKISISASDVSYGEVLRTLQRKLGWEIEIPALADELKLSYIRVEDQEPQDALAELLAGSGLGYAFLGGGKGSRILKAVVLPSSPPEGSVTPVSSFPIPDDAQGSASLPLPTQTQAVTVNHRLGAASTMPLSEAINAIGVPPGASSADVGRATTFSMSDAAKIIGIAPDVSPADVGRATTFPISEAAKIIGVAPDVSPADVGRATTFPISEAAKIIGVAPGRSPDDVAKTITLPLTTGAGRLR